MPKSVTLSTGRSFLTKTAAKAYFENILKSQAFHTEFSGNDLIEIDALFRDYCTKTQWPLPNCPLTFYPTYDTKSGFSTLCYGYRDVTENEGSFSYGKAIDAISG